MLVRGGEKKGKEKKRREEKENPIAPIISALPTNNSTDGH
jgi:hypothetical protein